MFPDISFKSILQKYPIVVVDVYADWCVPCKRVKDTVYSLYNQTNSNVVMADLDIDNQNNRDVYSFEKVRSIPTFICYVNGEKRDVLMDSNLDEVTSFFKRCSEY